ncbi:MAG: FlgO family outer membrane protein [Paraglaciecola sp.]|uniref:FlgO family outer membrane protein n=1 Tax=Paraglaciecola sp. TaxID=1920173 RepID=UPI0027402023|nr:FlgO family outer membrane protein [Paraglaciecola sp.]MDP5030559.1 FlgO family outer membrane protein [Paraglaciecola sp.]MDP5133867.1 FlgO family outer membrane protein [Paraglaciecola sp.]
MQNFFLLFIAASILQGCSNLRFDGAETSSNQGQQQDSNTPKPQFMHFYVEQLTRQLLATSNNIDQKKSIAVGTILPSTLKSGNNLPADPQFGLQIQESLLTLVTQAGLSVIEYKTMPSIKIGSQHDVMLSRDIETLNSQVNADYFLTGTYTAMEESTMVNLRLIEVPSNKVVAAATDYIPADAMWSKTKVSLKNNHIYRAAY